VFDPSRAPSGSTAPGGIATLAARGALFKRVVGGRAFKRWTIRLIGAAVFLAVVWVLFVLAVGISTTDMWFNSVHAGSVYTTMLRARILLFCVFAVLAGLIVGLSFVALRRIGPLYLSPDNDTIRWTFRRYEPRIGRLIVALAVLIPAVAIGRQAASGWQTYLLWRHATAFHSTDPLFHKDTSFFVEIYPFHQMVITLLLQAVTYALWAVLISGYFYGVWRWRGGRQKIVSGFTSLVSSLAAGYLVLRAINYWLSRYALTTSQRGPVTGASYTDEHAALPGAYVLAACALVGAVALIVNARFAGRGHRFLGRMRGLAAVVVLVVVASTVVGSAWSGLLYHFREAPSAAKLDLGEIAHNQKATRAAFALDGNVTTVPYATPTTTSSAALEALTAETAQPSVIDPNQLSPTFNVEQQLQSYYGFKSTLDTSHYEINGRSQDVALAVRELRSGGIPGKSWVNTHLVYTHGYGVVAAPTTRVDPKTESPVFLNAGIPPAQQIPVTRPQVYFGQGFGPTSYAIVGQPAGSSRQLEFDHPGGSGSAKSARTTYAGNGGVSVGSALRRLLFAVKLHDPNVLFSSELNSASQLLMVRNPRTRVAKVAPWLTLDGNVYPAVVNGQIKWIVDGYTTSSNFPNSQMVNLQSATRTTLTANGASITQPSTAVNYMHNSVKAVVDAYTGRVSLYEWNQQAQPDPLLKAWEGVFPGLVKPQSDISAALLTQLRYPADLFNVQRTLLAKYHVTQPASFYSGSDFWTVPTDPTVAATSSINAQSGSSLSSAPLPSKYMSISADGYSPQQYSLSSPMVTLNGHGLAAFVDVNSEPGPDYGKFTVLTFPSGSGGESPSQVQNDIESNTAITEALTLQRGGNSSVVLGDLEAIPIAGRILYIEPVYTQASGGASFPVLRHVIALYGNGDPSFENSPEQAISDAFRSAAGGG
jgi:uncharacterized protein